MTRPYTDLPRVHDTPPGALTGVPTERDPLTGKLLAGDALGRGDKGRTARSRRPAAVAASAAVIAAVTVTVLFAGSDDRTPAAAAPMPEPTVTATASPTTPAPPPPPVDPGPRVVAVRVVTVAVEELPHPGPQADISVGDALDETWSLTGPCDGLGPCTLLLCAPGGDCGEPIVAVPGPAGYTWSRTNHQPAPCEALEVTTTWTFTVSGDPLAPVVTGRISQTSPALEAPNSEGTGPCYQPIVQWDIVPA